MRNQMMNNDDFARWIESAHSIFEIFEARHDAYPLAARWANEWFSNGRFSVSDDDRERLRLIANFDCRVFDRDIDGNMACMINDQFRGFLRSFMSEQSESNVNVDFENVGFAIAPYLYLFTWNFQRFKEYFKRNRDFSFSEYFQRLGEFIENMREELNLDGLRDGRLLEREIDPERVTSIFGVINNNLKRIRNDLVQNSQIRNQNEPVGTAKLLHIMAPYYFPLIDNLIARAVGLISRNYNVALTSSHYHKWMVRLKECLQSWCEIIEEIERCYNLSILKLVDEGLYVMCSINIPSRLGL